MTFFPSDRSVTSITSDNVTLQANYGTVKNAGTNSTIVVLEVTFKTSSSIGNKTVNVKIGSVATKDLNFMVVPKPSNSSVSDFFKRHKNQMVFFSMMLLFSQFCSLSYKQLLLTVFL